MREFTLSLSILVLAAALVYGGLNIAELGVTGLLARECGHEAFCIRKDSQEVFIVTFAGRSARLHAGELGAALRQWWDRLLHRPAANLEG